MKILFISTPKAVAGDRQLKPLFKTPPTTHLWLAGLVMRHGHEAAILDAIALGLSESEIYDRVAAEAPDAVGFTAFTAAFFDIRHVALGIKQRFPRIRVLVGGYHVNSVPDDFCDPAFDISVAGEGERAIIEILDRLQAGRDAMDGVPGAIWFDKAAGRWRKELQAPFIADFDDQPILPYEMVLHHRYDTWWATIDHSRQKFMAILTGKGCAMGCSFCDITKTEGARYRRMSTERVLDELEHLHRNLGVTHVEIRDPFFTADLGRARAIAEGIIARGLKIEWGFSTTARKIKDPEFLDVLYRSGGRFVFIGVESGNPEILKREKKVTPEQVLEVVRGVRKARIQVHCSFIFGLEGDTAATLKQTMDFAIRLNPTSASFSIAIPYPGTALYESYRAKNYIKTTDWRDYGGESPVFETDELSADLMLSALKKAHRRFYFRPSFIVKKMASVRSLDQILFYIKVGFSMLFDVLSYKR